MTEDNVHQDKGDRIGPSLLRRTVLGTVGAAGVASVTGIGAASQADGSAQQPAKQLAQGGIPPAQGYADRVLLDGKIVTIDDHEINSNPGTVAEAMAIRNGRVLAIGDNDEIRSYVGADTELVWLDGKTVLPGIVESHVHTQSTVEELFPEELAPNGVHVALRGEETPQATVDKFENMINQVELNEGEWIFAELRENPDAGITTIWQMATGWIGTEDPADQEITREQLTEIVPNNPLAMGVRITDLPEAGQVIRFDRQEGEEVLLEGGGSE